MAMSRLTFLQFISISILVSLSVFGREVTFKFEHFISIVDTISEELFEFNRVSLVTCTIKCAINWACVTLLYSPKIKSCKTLREYINGNFTNCSKESGDWKYYTFPYASTCLELHTRVPAVSGVYRIYPWGDRQRPVDVYCDMKTQGGGWTAIQRRVYDYERFNRTWSEYKKGFGSTGTGYWLGNDLIHNLTVEKATSLYVSITLTAGATLYERYDQFYITVEADGYRIQLTGNTTGSLGDSMRVSWPNWNINGMKFSTFDRDNDMWTGGVCGHREGGWWFNECGLTFLNSDPIQNVLWDPVLSSKTQVRETMMMIK